MMVPVGAMPNKQTKHNIYGVYANKQTKHNIYKMYANQQTKHNIYRMYVMKSLATIFGVFSFGTFLSKMGTFFQLKIWHSPNSLFALPNDCQQQLGGDDIHGQKKEFDFFSLNCCDL